jgi:hypothetical protein
VLHGLASVAALALVGISPVDGMEVCSKYYDPKYYEPIILRIRINEVDIPDAPGGKFPI